MHSALAEWEQVDRVPPKPGLVASSKIYLGCSGWFYWHWRGGFYPSEMPTKDWFKHYASKFKTAKINAPFYLWPSSANVRTWIRQAGRSKFIYTVKVSELITHVERFTGTKILVRDFGHIADLLRQRMGCFLFQLPPSFHYSPARLNGLSPNWTRLVKTLLNSDAEVGGTRKRIQPFELRPLSSARAAVHAYRIR